MFLWQWNIMEFYNYIKKLPLPKKQYLPVCTQLTDKILPSSTLIKCRNKLPIIGSPKRKKKIQTRTHTHTRTHAHTTFCGSKHSITAYLQATGSNHRIQLISDEKTLSSSTRLAGSTLSKDHDLLLLHTHLCSCQAFLPQSNCSVALK